MPVHRNAGCSCHTNSQTASVFWGGCRKAFQFRRSRGVPKYCRMKTPVQVIFQSSILLAQRIGTPQDGINYEVNIFPPWFAVSFAWKQHNSVFKIPPPKSLVNIIWEGIHYCRCSSFGEWVPLKWWITNHLWLHFSLTQTANRKGCSRTDVTELPGPTAKEPWRNIWAVNGTTKKKGRKALTVTQLVAFEAQFRDGRRRADAFHERLDTWTNIAEIEIHCVEMRGCAKALSDNLWAAGEPRVPAMMLKTPRTQNINE